MSSATREEKRVEKLAASWGDMAKQTWCLATGIVERSYRTDNEELFQVMRFTDPEMRRYQLKLWDSNTTLDVLTEHRGKRI